MTMNKPVGYLTNSLTGIEGDPGAAYSYILASNGLFLRARNEHLAVTICLALQEIRGLAPLGESIQFIHGKIPTYFLNLALSVLSAKPDTEKYLAIVWDGQYRLKEPPQEAGPGHVTYDVLPNTVLDIHSHTGSMPAIFSGIDDHDEKGFAVYAVAAELRNLFPTVAIRLGTYGYMLDIEKNDVFI
jgi:PRTRC genetic system protein A